MARFATVRIPAWVGVVVYGEGSVWSRVKHRDVFGVSRAITFGHATGDNWIVLEVVWAGVWVEGVVGGGAVIGSPASRKIDTYTLYSNLSRQSSAVSELLQPNPILHCCLCL